MQRRVGLAIVSVLALAACGEPAGVPPASVPPSSKAKGPPIDPSIFPKPGATSFMSANTQELLSDGSGVDHRGYNAGNALSEDASAGKMSPPTPAPTPEPVPDVTREIVEADLYKVEGNLLYVLNRYRGLLIIDVTNPDKMFIRGRLPFQAMPLEMYVRDGRAYVVSSDHFEYWQYDPEADPHGFHGSQVMIVDVSKPDQPVRLGSLQVDGEVTDTRMVGDVLYAVSKRRPDYYRYNTADWEDRTWIVSLNVANPAAIKEIDRLTFSGTSTLIHVAHHAIFVAAWDPNFYLTGAGLEQETLVTYVDISDKDGKLQQRGTVYVPGQIADKFKLDWFDGHLRVLSQRWQAGNDVSLHVIATTYPDTLKIDKTITVNGITRSGLRATRFAEKRAFALTSDYQSGQTVRRLHGLDLSQPLQPQVAGELAVDVDSTHLEVHGDRLLLLGRHSQKQANGYYDTRVAVALFDVASLAAMQLLSWQRLGQGQSWSQANQDYKAFKTFPSLGLILVPLQWWVQNTSFTGLQLVDWVKDTITERGHVENTGGVERAFPVGNRLLAVGSMSAVTIDATNRDAPTVTRQLKLVHQVHDVFDVQGLQVQLVTDPYSLQVRLEVRPFGAEDDSPTLAELDLPFSGKPFVLRDGDVLHLIGNEPKVGQTIRNAVLTSPKKPTLEGYLLLSDANWSIYQPGWGWYQHYWSPAAGLPLRNQILAATFRKVITGPKGRRDWHSELRFLDLRDAKNPRVATGTATMDDFPFVNKVTHGSILYSTHVEQATTAAGASLLYHVRSYVDRVDVSDPDKPLALPSVNIPGYLVDVSDDGKVWYTVDYQWDEFGRRRNSLNVLQLSKPDTAVLMSVLPVADQINRAAMRPGQLAEHGGRPVGWDNHTIWLTAHKYPWWGVMSDTVSSRQPYTVLTRVDFTTDGVVAAEQQATLQGYHFDLLDVDGAKVYLGSNGPTGLLVLDAQSAAKPTILHTARTLGYLSRIVVNSGSIYAPLGMYGLQRY